MQVILNLTCLLNGLRGETGEGGETDKETSKWTGKFYSERDKQVQRETDEQIARKEAGKR